MGRPTRPSSLPGAVEIHVREHEPKMLLALNDLWLVSNEGEVFKRADSGALDYPVLGVVDRF